MITEFNSVDQMGTYFALARHSARIEHAQINYTTTNGNNSGAYDGSSLVERFKALTDPDVTVMNELLDNFRSQPRNLHVQFKAEYKQAMAKLDTLQERADKVLEEKLSKQQAIDEQARKEQQVLDDANAKDFAARLAAPSLIMGLVGVSQIEKAGIAALWQEAQANKGLRELSYSLSGLGFSAIDTVALCIEHFPEYMKFGGNPLSVSFDSSLDAADMRYQFMQETQTC